MAYALRIFGLLGFSLFSLVFSATFYAPDFVEKSAKDFITEQVKQETNSKINTIGLGDENSSLNKLAERLQQANQQRIDALKKQLANSVHQKLASVIAEMSDLSCECRQDYAARLKQNYQNEMLTLHNANEKLSDFMKTKYMDVTLKLKRDVRIFAASNALAMLMLFVISLVKQQAIKHLYLPAALLFIATTLCSYFYIFEQNWFFNIVYDDFLGWTYLGYLGIVYMFLCDIALNRARITRKIINAIAEAFGSAVSAGPC